MGICVSLPRSDAGSTLSTGEKQYHPQRVGAPFDFPRWRERMKGAVARPASSVRRETLLDIDPPSIPV
jgi:hypothetical protein